MKIFYSLGADCDLSGSCVLAVGNFDGVHRGHQLIFKAAVGRARETGLEAVLLTFSSHPAAVIRPGEAPHPLMTVPDRLRIAERFGFDTAIVLDFDPQLAALSPAMFVEDVLAGRLGVKVVVAGPSWRFGHRREGDMAMLDSLGRHSGVEALVVDPYMIDDLPVSSTRIREALAAGDVGQASKLLGRPHFVRGAVVSGKGRGRELGFPTVNLNCGEILIPGEGVYSGGYHTAGDLHEAGAAAISIGSSPTFAYGSFAVEAHLVGWKEDLYGKNVAIAFLDRLRDQLTFSSAKDLADQIALDVEKARGNFSTRELKEIPFESK